MSTEYTEARALLDEAIEHGVDPDVLAEHLDGLIDWRAAIPGPIGVVLESLDGQAARAIVTATRRTLKRLRLMAADPEFRARRQAERAAAKLERVERHKVNADAKAARQKATADKKAAKATAKRAAAKAAKEKEA